MLSPASMARRNLWSQVQAVVAAVEKNGRGVGRIRLRRGDDVSAASLLSFVTDVVTPGTEVHTDGWRAYSRLKHAGYQHQVTVIELIVPGRTPSSSAV